jgi:Mg2+/Co2+ transporter CorB
MIPRQEIVGIDLNEDWDKILSQLTQTMFTRMPVYRENIDQVEGLFHIRSIIGKLSADGLTYEDLVRSVSPSYFIPEGTNLMQQLLEFQSRERRMGLVVDEYGDIQGIITLEDILEEIVGEFTSEPVPAHADVRRDDKAGYVVKASANVRALNRMMKWHLPTNGPKTLNGLILEQLETIPEKGTGLMLNDYPIEILLTSGNVVKSVRIGEPLPGERAVAG